MQETRSICCYCGTGCGLIIEQDENRITGVRGDPAHPANFGRLCSKGATLHLTSGSAGRALHPELRQLRDQPRRPVGWAEALDAAADRFADVIRRHGPDSVAFYVSGQLLTEDYYVFNKLARALIGTNNIDSNSRLCMSSAVSGYKATLGADSVPTCYEDLGLADHLLIAGSNTAWAHPILFRRIEDAKRANPDLSITVIDPRRTETAEFADLHLQNAPGSDLLLFNAMLHVMLWEDLIDRAFIRDHTSGFAELREALAECSPGNVATACGVPAAQIVEAARRFGSARAALSLWCQGLNQSHHGVANNAALIHLHLATGQIGRPGAGPFSLTGQPNAMGGREVGALATLLPGHRELANPSHRAEMAGLWGVPDLNPVPGLPAVALFDALAEGRVKAVWIACTNPAQSLPDQRKVRAALSAAEFVVVQEAYADTETADFADLLLPAASWGEKEGTVTNSERRVSRVRRAVSAPGEARPDWAIVADFAGRLATRLGRDPSAFAFRDEAAVFAEHVSTTVGRDCDLSGLSHALLDERGPQQWPYTPRSETGRARLFEDHRFPTDDGRARFAKIGHPVKDALTPEPVDARHPFRLLSGRLRDQWHGMSRTGKSPILWGHTPRAEIALNPADLARRDWEAGTLLRIGNRRGALVLPVVSDDAVAPGHAWVPMHWGGATLAQAGVNEVCSAVTDPVSAQPALKAAAVSLSRLDVAWRAAWAQRADDMMDAQRRMTALRPYLAGFDYAALTLIGEGCPVVVLRVASVSSVLSSSSVNSGSGMRGVPGLDRQRQARLDGAARAGAETSRSDAMVVPAVIEALDALFGLAAGDQVLAFEDAGRGVSKRAAQVDGRLHAVRLAGECVAFDWLVDAIAEGRSITPLRPWLFAPVARPPIDAAARGRTVCNCFGISTSEIDALLMAGVDLPGLQQRLKCGTACGSCLPELRRRVRTAGSAQAVRV